MSRPHAEAFFLDADPGRRFCLFHAPAGPRCLGALVYLHPFGDEMNKSRRMAALQARALAAAGIGVLQIDLYGCGDSNGEFHEARWDIWKRDVAAACAWLQARLGRPVGLWGLRTGALLALDYAHGAALPPASLLLWQPVLGGATFLTQFLRIRVAGAMLSGEENAGTAGLRQALAAGDILEIGGYELAPALAAALDGADAAALPPPCPVDWFELAPQEGRALPARSARLAADWQALGLPLRLQQVVGPAFWTSQEIEEAPTLLVTTVAAMTERSDG